MEQADSRVAAADRLFLDALELPESERETFVRTRCRADGDLERTVLKMLEGFGRLGSFLEMPAGVRVGGAELAAGDLLAGRFEVVERIGAGGMGIVYRAVDHELNETIALKTIIGEWATSDPGASARFRDEIALARRVSHPNVCRINEVFREKLRGRDFLFLTMEFLSGETLAERLKRSGPLPLATVSELVGQLAAGLHAVHSAGIIHRDLKPSNVFLGAGPRERVVLMDFGLAKPELPSETYERTQTGAMVGSPDYMAPEQFLGEIAGPATDIYALGLIVFEMVSGVRPFGSGNVLRTAMQRISGKPIRLGDAAKGIPHSWDRAIARAICREPSKRYQDALAFAAALHASPRISLALSRRQWIAAGASAAAMSSIVLAIRYSRWSLTIPPSPTLLMAHLDSSLPAATTRSVEILLRRQLDQSSRIRTLSEDRIKAALARMGAPASALPPRVYREAALREGVPVVIFGSLGQMGGDRVLNLKIELLDNSVDFPGRTFKRQFVEQGDAGLAQATADAVSWVRQTLGESAAEIAARTRPPQELTTADWNALREFAIAGEVWGASPQGKGSEQALDHLRTAVGLDPSFAMAHARLGDYLVALGRTDEGLREQRMAARLLASRDLTDRESLRIRGMYLSDTGQFQEAAGVYARWCSEYPADAVALFYRSSAEHRTGAAEQSDRLLAEAVRLDPQTYAFRMWQCLRRLEHGDLDAADRLCDGLDKQQPEDWTRQLRCAVAFARYRGAEVWSHLERLRSHGSPLFQSRAFEFQACFRAEQGRHEECAGLLREGILFDRSHGLTEMAFQKRVKIVETEIARGLIREAQAGALELLPDAAGDRLKMRVGALLARAGDVANAERCLVPAPAATEDLPLGATPVYEHWRKRLSLEIALARGDRGAIAQYVDRIPPPDTENEWPEYRVRALSALRRREDLIGAAAALLRFPGRYWFAAYRVFPGFFRAALAALEQVHAKELSPGAQSLMQLFR